MSLPPLNLRTDSGKPRCQERVSYGSTWDAGRKQCGNVAARGYDVCKTHLAKRERRRIRNEG